MTRVLVTGASGFVGRILSPMLEQSGYKVRAALRSAECAPVDASERIVVGAIDDNTRWDSAVNGVEMVMHLAARVHLLNQDANDPVSYLDTNAYGTRRLAEEAARRGIRRFVYLSSVKVNGEGDGARAYAATDVPHPADAYAVSKWRGEQLLAELGASSGMHTVVVRAPLVYGSGVRANFLRLLRWVDRERLLPFGAIHNARSLVNVWNLCDLLIRVLHHPAAVDRTWMVSDRDDVSTPELVRRIARALGRRARLLAVPTPLLQQASVLLRKGSEFHRLCGSLTVDTTPAAEQLGWSPPVSMGEALARTASWYRAAEHSLP